MSGRSRNWSSSWSTTRPPCVSWRSSSWASPGGMPARPCPPWSGSRDDPSAEVRQQAKAACEQIRNDAGPGRPKDLAPNAATTHD